MPSSYIQWVMLLATTVSYTFNINGKYTEFLQAKRGIRQGDPISPLIFVLMMEYMNRCLVKMQKDPNFNHHVNCKKIGFDQFNFC